VIVVKNALVAFQHDQMGSPTLRQSVRRIFLTARLQRLAFGVELFGFVLSGAYPETTNPLPSWRLSCLA
jgi:hypothetical protein